jgi:hypothetical protein
MKIRSVGLQLLHAARQTWGHQEAIFVALQCEHAKEKQNHLSFMKIDKKQIGLYTEFHDDFIV